MSSSRPGSRFPRGQSVFTVQYSEWSVNPGCRGAGGADDDRRDPLSANTAVGEGRGGAEGPGSTWGWGWPGPPGAAPAGPPGLQPNPGDPLPPKKQAVIERLRRRFELYRRHQDEGFPRYEAAANGVYDQQKQETLLLRQRFLESKAKKAKKGDHKNAAKEAAAAANNGANADNQRSLLAQKLKRSAPGGSPLNLNSDNLPDDNDRANKIPRTNANAPDSGPPGGGGNPTGSGGGPRDQKFQQQQQQQSNNQSQQQISGFSVQIVQQFTSSASPKSQHSQTIQTNVTVQALPNSVKTSNSPSNNLSGQDDIGASISVGTNFECKRERETDLGTCGGPTASNNSANNSNNNNHPSANRTTSNSAAETLSASDSDRFAETLANLGFPDDSNDELHADILNTLFDDDIFTNSTDLMKDFNFDDAMKDGDGDDRDLGAVMMDMDRALAAATAASQQQQQMQNFQFNQSAQQMFDQNSSRPGFGGGGGGPRMNFNPLSPNVMDFKLREPSPAAQTLKQMAEQHQSMQQKQMGLGLGSPHHHHPQSPFSNDSFDPLSSLRTNFLNGSPSSGLSPLSKGPPSGMQFGGPSFGQQPSGGHQSPGSQQQQQQSAQAQPPQPTGAFSAGLRPAGGVVFKQEANTGMYPGLNSGGGGPGSCKNPLVGGPTQAEIQEMRNRQAQQMQRITPDQKPPTHMDSQYTGQSNTTGPVGSPIDQKPNLTGKQMPTQTGHPGSGVPNNAAGPGPPNAPQQQQQSAYAATRPLSHFTDPVSSQSQGGGGPSVQSIPNRQSPVSVGNMGGQFMRSGGPAAGMTPSPPVTQGSQQGHFAASPQGQNRPSSGPSIHMSQTQQLQINQGNQQLQIVTAQALLFTENSVPELEWLSHKLFEAYVARCSFNKLKNLGSASVSQSQQLQINQDVKPQVHQQTGSTPNNQPQGPPVGNQPPRDGNVYNYQTAQQQHQSQSAVNNQYQLSMAQSQSVSFGSQYGNPQGQGPRQSMAPNLSSNMETPVSNRGRRQAQFVGGRPPPEYKPQPNFAPNKTGGIRYPQNTRAVPPYPESVNPRGMAPQNRPQGMNPADTNPYQSGGPVGPNPNANVQTSQSQTKAPAASLNKPVYTSALSRNRAPNVNVGPEGLNISQRPPAEWRQMFLQQAQLQQQQQQQQQQHQMQMQQQQQMSIRMQSAQAQRFQGGYRPPQPNVFNSVPQQGPGGVPPMNNNPLMMRSGHHPNMAQMQHVQQQLHQQAQHALHVNQVRGVGMTRAPRQRGGVMTQQQHAVMRQALDSVSQQQQQQQQQQNQMLSAQMASSQQMYASVTQRAPPPRDNSGSGKPQDPNSIGVGGVLGSDANQFNLDFLDSIEPTTSDLLNFDSMGTAHFSGLLDDM